jgi:isocitrate dehydrogenase
MYWAESLAANSVDQSLADTFAGPAEKLAQSEDAINAELLAAQGSAVDIGGYYHPNEALASDAMRPSGTLNAIIDAIGS